MESGAGQERRRVGCRGRCLGGGSAYNHYWLRTDPDSGPADQYVSAYYLSRWGNDEAKDNNGTVIPDC